MKLKKHTALFFQITALLMSAILCLLLAACSSGNGKSPVTDKNAAPTEPRTETKTDAPGTKAPPTTKPRPETDETPTTAKDPDPITPVTFAVNSTAGVEQTFSNVLPEKFQAESAVKFDCNNYDKDQSSGVQSFTELGITHRYTNPSEATAKLVFVVNVAEAGTYDLCIDMRMKDGNHRYNLFSVNGGEAITMDFEIPADQLEGIRDDTHSSFMTGYQVQLKEGQNTITITNPTGIDGLKTMHWRNLYLVKAAAEG